MRLGDTGALCSALNLSDCESADAASTPQPFLKHTMLWSASLPTAH